MALGAIEQQQETLVEEFAPIEGWLERYEHLIAMGEELPPMASKLKNAEHAVGGCQAQLWIAAEMVQGRIVFQADSDAKITRGLVALILRVVNHQPPDQVLEADFGFLDAIGLRTRLSPSRANGLAAIIKRIRELAASLG